MDDKPLLDLTVVDVKLTYEVKLLDQRIQLLEAARKLQAGEYARRLDELNHAHAQAQQKEADFVRRESLDQYRDEYLSFRDEVKAHMGASTASRAAWASAVALALSLIGVWMGLR